MLLFPRVFVVKLSVMKILFSTLFLVFCLLLNACGFQPVYGTNHSGLYQSSVTENFSRVYIENIPDREGQYLRNALIDRFYKTARPANPEYNLSVSSIQEAKTDLDITKSSDATRAQLRLRITVILTGKNADKPLVTRNLTAITSYNVLKSQFTTRVSEDNARLNALDELARQIEMQLSLYFARASQPQTQP